MKHILTILLCAMTMILWGQQSSCGFAGMLDAYNRILPIEKIYAQTDQSYYEPGETIWFKAYVLDEQLQADTISNQVYAQLLDPLGNEFNKIRLPILQGSAYGDFILPKAAKGGIYTLKVYTTFQQNYGEELIFTKKLTVQKNIYPNILMTLDFMRESYGPGDEVMAKFEARSKDNKALAAKECDFSLQLAGKTIKNSSFSTDEQGMAMITFSLPKELNTADGLLNIKVQHDGRTESIARSVPIVTQNISLNLFPEGGDLIAGMENRIAFKAIDEFGSPVDFKAIIIDSKGKKLQQLSSYHQGMGAFSLNIDPNENYQLKIVEPLGINQKFGLPKALNKEIGLYTKSQQANNIELNLYSPEKQQLCLVAQMKGKVIYEEGITAQEGQNEVTFLTDNFPVGILQVTIFDENQIPHAERLYFINKDRQLRVSITTDRQNYQIRDSVNVQIQVTDETGKGVPGEFSMAVVDDKVFTFADDKQANILSYLLLSTDLKGEIYEPNFYFDPKEEKADQALDYVMLTHGWRRYNWRTIVAENAEKQWHKQRQFEPEPKFGIEGQLLFGRQPKVNSMIQIESTTDCYQGKKQVKTDEKGLFYIPLSSYACQPKLKANYRGFSASYNHQKQTQYHPSKNKGAAFQKKQFIPSTPIRIFQKKGVYSQRSLQGNGAIKGRITEERMGEAVMLASVALKDERGQIVDGASTDFEGNYALSDITPGVYLMEVRYVGYRRIKVSVEIKANQLLQQDLRLQEDAPIQEVTVVGEQRTVMSTTMAAVATTRVDRASISRLETDFTRVKRTTKKAAVTKEDDIIRKIDAGNVALLDDEIKQLGTRNARELAGSNAGVNRMDDGAPINAQVAQIAELRAVPVEQIALEDILIRGPRSPNSLRKERLRAAGEFRPLRGSNRNALNAQVASEVPVQNLQFKILSKGQPEFYSSRTFYAPDYTQYLQARNQGRANSVSRYDFRNTIYWQPNVQTDEEGKATILFYNADATTTYRIVVEGIGQHGVPGRAEHSYSVQMPFDFDVKMPKELTMGDTVLIPVVLKNSTNQGMEGQLNLKIPNELKLLWKEIPAEQYVEANSTTKLHIPFYVQGISHRAEMYFTFISAGHYDQQLQTVQTNYKGFPMQLSLSGQSLERKGSFSITDPVEGSIDAKFEIYFNVLEDMQSSMESMLREPHGCFEQVSSTTYPNIMAVQFMKANNQLRPEVMDRALGYINNGYKKLAGYESAGGGFEWFGKNPAHESLTAYGLIEFKDMAEIYPKVDQAMIERARKWLLSRKDGEGGYTVKSGYSHGWGQSQKVFNAYITYALAYVGESNIQKELDAATNEALASKDLYRLGLMALAHREVGNSAKAKEILQVLNRSMDKQKLDKLTAEHNITYGTGSGLRVEIIAMSILANLQAETVDHARIEKQVNHLMTLRRAGRFGYTQSTIWALKALMQYTLHKTQQKLQEGNFILEINGKEVFQQQVNAESVKSLSAKQLSSYFQTGKNDIVIRFEDTDEVLPYSLQVDWVSLTPNSSKKRFLDINTQLQSKEVALGENVRLSTTITNTAEKDAPSAMAKIGIPAGLSLQPWQLKEMLDKKRADFYEITGNYLVLYYRNIPAGESRSIQLDLKAEIPGCYRAPASNAYMYYMDQEVHWVKGEEIQVLKD